MPTPDQSGSPFPAARSRPLLHEHGGKIAARPTLPISALGNDYTVEGSGTVTALPALPAGCIVTLRILANPTFKNSAKLICPAGVDYVGVAGDMVFARSDGGSIWRLFVLGGNPGELIESHVDIGSAISLASGTRVNLGSINLGPGEFDCSLHATFNGASSTTVTSARASISETSATEDGTTPGALTYHGVGGSTLFASDQLTLHVGPLRKSITASTTIYGVVAGFFGTSTMQAYGIIRARRVR